MADSCRAARGYERRWPGGIDFGRGDALFPCRPCHSERRLQGTLPTNIASEESLLGPCQSPPVPSGPLGPLGLLVQEGMNRTPLLEPTLLRPIAAARQPYGVLAAGLSRLTHPKNVSFCCAMFRYPRPPVSFGPPSCPGRAGRAAGLATFRRRARLPGWHLPHGSKRSRRRGFSTRIACSASSASPSERSQGTKRHRM